MTTTNVRAVPHQRRDYRQLFQMETRWKDMDLYGHMNNVTYLEYFDSAVNRALIMAGVLDLPGATGPIGLVAQSRTDYFSEITYPESVTVGLRIDRIGSTSLAWGFALFREGDDLAAAQGGYVHVYVDRATRKPQALSPGHRAMAEALTVPQP